MTPCEEIYRDERLTAFLCGPLCITVWSDAPQLAQVDAFERALDQAEPEREAGCPKVLESLGLAP